MRGVTKALSSLRPAGCSAANIQSSVHSPLWKGRGSWEGGPHQLHGKLRSHYLCAYTPTWAALGHATLCHATVLCSGYRWPDKEDINNAFCAGMGKDGYTELPNEATAVDFVQPLCRMRRRSCERLPINNVLVSGAAKEGRRAKGAGRRGRKKSPSWWMERKRLEGEAGREGGK
ncbi:hypothetical protein KM043_015887 [Ampulex compressa]|nr:hypothetical protein KM043_015887 [Ampulex compressa]